MNKNRRDALRVAISELSKYMEERETSRTEEEFPPDKIEPGDALHTAIQKLEQTYPDKKMPLDGPWRLWQRLLKLADAEDLEAWDAADELMEKLTALLDRAQRTPT